MSRREFLRLSAVGAVGAVAASCAPAATRPPAPIIIEQESRREPVQVETRVVAATAAGSTTATQVKGTFWVIQKKDFFPDMNDWFRAEMTKYCKEKGWPLDITYEAGYTGGSPFLEKLSASAAAGNPPTC